MSPAVTLTFHCLVLSWSLLSSLYGGWSSSDWGPAGCGLHLTPEAQHGARECINVEVTPGTPEPAGLCRMSQDFEW